MQNSTNEDKIGTEAHKIGAVRGEILFERAGRRKTKQTLMVATSNTYPNSMLISSTLMKVFSILTAEETINTAVMPTS